MPPAHNILWRYQTDRLIYRGQGAAFPAALCCVVRHMVDGGAGMLQLPDLLFYRTGLLGQKLLEGAGIMFLKECFYLLQVHKPCSWDEV